MLPVELTQIVRKRRVVIAGGSRRHDGRPHPDGRAVENLLTFPKLSGQRILSAAAASRDASSPRRPREKASPRSQKFPSLSSSRSVDPIQSSARGVPYSFERAPEAGRTRERVRLVQSFVIAFEEERRMPRLFSGPLPGQRRAVGVAICPDGETRRKAATYRLFVSDDGSHVSRMTTTNPISRRKRSGNTAINSGTRNPCQKRKNRTGTSADRSENAWRRPQQEDAQSANMARKLRSPLMLMTA